MRLVEPRCFICAVRPGARLPEGASAPTGPSISGAPPAFSRLSLFWLRDDAQARGRESLVVAPCASTTDHATQPSTASTTPAAVMENSQSP